MAPRHKIPQKISPELQRLGEGLVFALQITAVILVGLIVAAAS